MSQHAGVFRRTKGLKEASATIDRLQEEYNALPAAPFSHYSLETQNILIAARLVVDGALSRKENVGLHFNADLAVKTPSNGAVQPGQAKGRTTQAT
jgi:L-aspartate oxidase